MSSRASDDPIKVFCGKIEGMLDPSRFGPGVKSRCIEHRGRWLTPHEFEILAGKSAHYRWRVNIKTETGTRFGELIENGFLKSCSANCKCEMCGDAVTDESVTPTSQQEVNANVKSELLLNVAKDNDSDSGISTISSTNNHLNQMTLLKTVSPLAKVISAPASISEQKNTIDYPSMVQEAISSLAGGQTDCTNLNILLYILNRHTPNDDISTIHTKVRTALSFLTRMGFVKRTGDEDDWASDDDSNDVSASEKPPSPKKPTKKTTLKESTKNGVDKPKKTSPKLVVKMKPKNLSVKKADELKAKAKGLNKKPKVKPVDENESENVAGGGKRIIAFRPKRLSPALATICGKKLLTRQDAVKRFWRYIKLRKLQDPVLKTKINCDDKLKAVTKRKRFDQREMFALLKPHMTDV